VQMSQKFQNKIEKKYNKITGFITKVIYDKNGRKIKQSGEPYWLDRMNN